MQRLLEYASKHPGLAVLAVGAALLVLVYELRERARAAGAVSPQDAVRLMNHGATVLDLRSAEAFGAGHIGGARHLPPERLGHAIDGMKRLKDRTIIVYGERGESAAGAMRSLQQQGFSQVVSLRGGLSAWRAEHMPVTRD